MLEVVRELKPSEMLEVLAGSVGDGRIIENLAGRDIKLPYMGFDPLTEADISFIILDHIIILS